MSKVLVIDDSEAWFAAVAAECEKAGYSAVLVADSVEAIEVATRQPPSMVVVDMLIAAKAGASFIRQLRSLPLMKSIPMLLATTGTHPHTARQALGGSSAEIVSKNERSLKTLSDRLRQLPVSA